MLAEMVLKKKDSMSEFSDSLVIPNTNFGTIDV